MRSLVLLLLVFGTLFPFVTCWDTEDFEIFDAVEEINRNFYELMGVSQEATTSEIKKAYRSLSLQLHPDKNKSPDADIQFRQMVACYEILKDENKRQRYNKVLVEGIPDWRSPIYYYRRARKMSLLEISIILTVVISITQYLMAWGSYWDKKHTLEDFLLRKFRIKDGKKRSSEDEKNLDFIQAQLLLIPKPKWWRILPVQLVQFIIFLVLHGPSLVQGAFKAHKDQKQRHLEELQRIQDEEKRLIEEEEKRKERKAEQKLRKKVNKKKMPDYTGIDTDYNRSDDNPNREQDAVEDIPVITGGPWLEEDYTELTRLLNKFPGGTTERWERIASAMNRTTYEVIKMSSRMKAGFGRPVQEEAIAPKVKVKTKKIVANEEGGDLKSGWDEQWTVVQQKALEKAIKKYPKGTEQRWERISNSVPDKTKEDCMMRFKFLAEKIRKKKEQEEATNEEQLENNDQIEDCDRQETAVEVST